MRYVVIALIILISVLLMCGIFVRFPVFSAEIDSLTVTMVLMLFFERQLTPVLYTAVGGIIIDSLFSRSFGFYTIPYIISGLIAFLYIEDKKPEGILPAMVISGAVYLVKELISMVLCVLLSYDFDIVRRLLTTVLPGIALQMAAAAVSYYLFKWLHSFAFMQSAHDPEYELLRKRRRRRR